MADEAGKDIPKEIHSREYDALGAKRFEIVCRGHRLTEFQTKQLDGFMAKTGGILITDSRYDKELKILLRTQIDKTPVLEAMNHIKALYGEIYSPRGPRARSKRGSN